MKVSLVMPTINVTTERLLIFLFNIKNSNKLKI